MPPYAQSQYYLHYSVLSPTLLETENVPRSAVDERIFRLFGAHCKIREENYPDFHAELKKHGRSDLSWKMDSCNESGIRLDCSEHYYDHAEIHPVPCLRRTCPTCGQQKMARAIERYQAINREAEAANERAGTDRVRFWTWTCRREEIINYRPVFKAFSTALRNWWRSTHGNSSPRRESGGLMCMEVGASGNVHAHGLIEGPFMRVKTARHTWRLCLAHQGLSGNRLEVKVVRDPGTIAEVIAYPLDPDKCKDLPERTLARVELALSGRRGGFDKHGHELTHIPAFRRMWTCGTWANFFPAIKHSGKCKVCGAPLTQFNDCNDLLGKPYHRGWFSDHENAEQHQQEFCSEV